MKLDTRANPYSVGYHCPACDSGVLSVPGIFTLCDRLLRLKCTCGDEGSVLSAEPVEGGKIALTVPCVFCPHPHTFYLSRELLSSDALEGEDAAALLCPVTRMGIAFIGEEDAVRDALEATARELSAVVEESGADTDDDGATSYGDGDADEVDTDNAADSEMYTHVMFVLNELLEDRRVFCDCADGEGDYHIAVTRNTFDVSCSHCHAFRKIPYNNSISALAFLDADSLTLTHGEN